MQLVIATIGNKGRIKLHNIGMTNGGRFFVTFILVMKESGRMV